MIQLRGHHWLLGAVIALLLYVGTAIAVLWRAPPPAAVADLGIGGIEIGLGPVGGASGEPETIEAEDEEGATKPEPEQEAQPEPEPEPQPSPKPKPEPQPKPEPRPKPVEKPPIVKSPTPSPVNRSAPPAAKAAATVAGTDGKSGTTAAVDQGTGDSSRGGGQVGQTDDYMAVLQTWLERHKEYPRRARRRRQEGTALLYFVMDRTGKVLRHEIRQSSGHRLLDREVLAMLERAQPLPAMPDSMVSNRLQLVVPVRFALH